MREPRYSLQWFARQCEGKLQENDSIKPCWSEMTRAELISHLMLEVLELHHAIKVEGPQAVIRECADVANLAHMLADKARGSEASAERGRM